MGRTPCPRGRNRAAGEPRPLGIAGALHDIFDQMRTRRKGAAPSRAAGAPFLHRVESLPEKIDTSTYPFNIRAFSHGRVAVTNARSMDRVDVKQDDRPS